MKRIVALFLALLLIIVSLMACDKELTPDTLPTRYTPGDGSYRYFADTDAQVALSLQLPSSWSVLRRNGSIFLTQDGVIIGSVSKAEIDDEEKKKLTLCHGDDRAEGEAVLAYYGKAMLSEEMQQCYVFRYLLNGSTFVFRIATAQMDKTSYAWLCAPASQDYIPRANRSPSGEARKNHEGSCADRQLVAVQHQGPLDIQRDGKRILQSKRSVRLGDLRGC